MFTVSIRYWAGARAAAGTDVEQWSARSVAHALEQARGKRSSAEFDRVIRVSAVLLDGRTLRGADLDRVLTSQVEIEILPPFAGG